MEHAASPPYGRPRYPGVKNSYLLPTRSISSLFAGVVVVSYFVDLFKESNSDMWKKIEDQVEVKIGQKLAQYHVERLYTEVFRVLERRVANADNFDSDDMEIILDKGLMVFPQKGLLVLKSEQIITGLQIRI